MNPDPPQRDDHENPPAQGRDSRLESFVRQAAPILAASRGLNETSLLKLQSLANDLRLPKGLYDRAILELKRSGAFVHLSRSEQQFMQFLKKEMEKLPGKILSAQLEARATHIGETKYQVQATRARELVREQAAFMGLERVSQSDAERYIESMCRDLIGQADVVAEDQLRRIREFGAHWGLNAEQCSAIWQRVAETTNAPRRWNLVKWVAMAAIAVLMIALGVVSTAMFFWNPNDTIAGRGSGDPSQIRERGLVPAPWWSGELYQQLVQVTTSNPELRDEFVAATSESDDSRRQAYLQLATVSQISNSTATVSAKLLGEMLASEPDPSTAREVLNAFAQQLTPTENERIARPDVVDNAARSATVLLETWRSTSSVELQGQIERIIQKAYGISLSATGSAAEMDDRLRTARNTAFWNHLISTAWTHPRDAIGLFQRLRQADFDEPALRRQAFAAILREHPNQWSILQNELKGLIENESNDQLLARLESLDAKRHPELANFVAGAMAERLKLTLEDSRFAAAYPLLKRTLVPPSARQMEIERRWTVVREEQRRLIHDPGNTALSEPQRIAHACYVATLALLLRQAELSATIDLRRFDELKSAGVPAWEQIALPAADQVVGYCVVNKPATAIERQQRQRGIERLLDPTTSHSTKLQALVSIAEVGDRFADLTPTEGKTIIDFMIECENPDDLVVVEACARRLRHWPTLALTFLDRLESQRPPADQAIPIYAAIFGESPRIANQTAWTQELRELGLRRMSEQLESSIHAATDSESHLWRQLERNVRALIQLRAAEVGGAFPRGSMGTNGGNVGTRRQDVPRPLGEMQAALIGEILAQSAHSENAATARSVDLVMRRFDEGLARVVFLEEILVQAIRISDGTPFATRPRAGFLSQRSLPKRFYDAEVQIVANILSSNDGDAE